MPYSIAICEDEAHIREDILRLVKTCGGEINAVAFESADALLAAQNSDVFKETGGSQYFDIYLLDIQMPGISGMELAHILREKAPSPEPVIVFITSLVEQMQDAFDVKAFHYLLKPLNEEKFKAVLGRVFAELARKKAEERITVKSSGTTYTVPLSDVFFAESSNKKVALSTRGGLVEYYGKISEFENKPNFFRSHRCYIVNMEHILRYSTAGIKLTNGQEISLSRKVYPDFVKAYLRYIGENGQ
jgi:DNA-binding LytR/AlgR family response regulator